MEKCEEHIEFLRELTRGQVPVRAESAKTAFKMTDEETETCFGALLPAQDGN